MGGAVWLSSCRRAVLTRSVERLGTVITSKWPLLRVRHNVSSQFTWSSKCLGAVRALVGFLSCVNVCVCLQRYRCGKTLITMFAVVGTFTYNKEKRKLQCHQTQQMTAKCTRSNSVLWRHVPYIYCNFDSSRFCHPMTMAIWWQWMWIFKAAL